MAAYRRRWQHDRVVRSTHGVNCTGSCSWKVHVKDGLVTWETQQTDYPSTAPTCPTTSRAAARAGRLVLLVRLLADPAQVPLRPRQSCSRCTARRASDRRPGRGVGADRRGPRARPRVQVAARQGRLRARLAGTRRLSWWLRPRPHDQAVRPRSDRRLLADPGDVDGLVLRRHAVSVADRRRLPLASTTGTRTCRRPRRRSGATRPTCPSQPTGGTPAT